jgi:glutathione S-transferase
LIPADLKQRAELCRWLLFTTTELEQPLWRIALHTSLYPQDKRLPGEVALARADFAAMAQVLDGHMQNRQFVMGESVTVADFVLAYTLDWAKLADALALPRLEAYMQRMYARPQAPMRIKEALAAIKP